MLKLSGMAAASAALATHAQQTAPADYAIDIAPYDLEVAPHRTIRTIAYNRQVPGPLLRLKEDQPVTIDFTTRPATAKWYIGRAWPNEMTVCPRRFRA
jgi:FtsP/CotA-like multicopper oxidase with cupredoxin domain